jgi:VIT1/CCC1 family predicted Fe2+/Mn2+ transporter
VLSPFERASEVLFGLIMALTLTGALGVAGATEHEPRALFVSTLACNLAWGLVDGVMYVFNALVERGRLSVVAHAVREGTDPKDLSALLAEVLPGRLAQLMSLDELRAFRSRLARDPDGPEAPRIHGEDLLGGVAVFFLVVASTFPVALPFLLISDPVQAKVVSRGLALVLLFVTGLALGRFAGLRPGRTGLATLGIGVVLVALVMALGG